MKKLPKMSSSNRFTSLGPEPSAAASSAVAEPSPQRPPKKRKGHRGGKKKRSRRKSFAILHDHEMGESSGNGFYQVAQASLSGTSIDSEALLDHR